MGDRVPGLTIDPMERIAVLRKGGEPVRLSEYGGQLGAQLVLGLTWDVTDGVEIDLDASVIMLDASLQLVDLVFFGKLASSDGSVRHGGDEREGDAKGDDEKIFIQLSNVHPSVAVLGIVINSYSGQELDDVHRCGCRLYDPSTVGRAGPLTQLSMTQAAFLNGKTACLVAMLYRNPADASDWLMRTIAEGAMGQSANDNVDELQSHLRSFPPIAKPSSQPRPPVQPIVLQPTPVMITTTVTTTTTVVGPGGPPVVGTGGGGAYP